MGEIKPETFNITSTVAIFENENRRIKTLHPMQKGKKMQIYFNMNHPTKSKMLLNKRPELMTPCNCTTSFLRLVDLFKRKRGADEVT